MKKLLVNLLMLLALVFFFSALGSDIIQIGTFNLHFFTDLDQNTGKWCEQYNLRTEQEIQALAQFIDSLDIEVLALEEVENDKAMDLLLSFMPPHKYAYIMLPQEKPYTCQRIAVLYQKQEVDVQYVGMIPLSLGRQGLRNALVTKVKVLPDGFDFTLVAVHLKAFNDEKSTQIRQEQLRILGDWIRQYLNNTKNDPDLILVGDFNEQLLTNKKAFSYIDSGFYDVLSDAPSRICTPMHAYWMQPIDHIVISPNAKNEYTGSCALYNFFSDPNLPHRYSFSDHCIAWADFSIQDLDEAYTLTVKVFDADTLESIAADIYIDDSYCDFGTACSRLVNEGIHSYRVEANGYESESGSVYVYADTTEYVYLHKVSDKVAHIVINEVELNPPGKDSGREWVELYNPSDNDVDIGGWSLSTTRGEIVVVYLPQGTIIKAHGYLIVSYRSQWLDNTNESVVLRDARGKEIDRTPLLNDTKNNNETWQRYPNGIDTDTNTDWTLKEATKGTSNGG